MQSAPLALFELERTLFDEPTAYDFFQAVHLLEQLQPERNSLGGFDDPEHEIVQIGVNPRLGFPASDIQALVPADGERPRMTVNFTGLTGPSGVLPYPYGTLLLERLAARDAALGEFFDLFHHRLASLLYAAWEKHRFSLRHAKEGRDPLTHHLRDVAGLGLDGEAHLGPLSTESLAPYAGLLGPEPRSGTALEQLVADYFDVPCRVEQFVGGWYAVSDTDYCLLGSPAAASTLGYGALVGDEVWDPQAAVRVRIGPLTRGRFDAFLPTGEAHEPLRTVLQLFGHGQFEFDVQLVLARQDVVGVTPGADTEHERLGWTSWIATQPRATDADETVLTV